MRSQLKGDWVVISGGPELRERLVTALKGLLPHVRKGMATMYGLDDENDNIALWSAEEIETCIRVLDNISWGFTGCHILVQFKNIQDHIWFKLKFSLINNA